MLSTSFTPRPMSSFYTDLVKGFIIEGEAIVRAVQAERAKVPDFKRRKSPAGEALRWAMNLVDIDVACVERLLQEIKDARSFNTAEKLIEELRKSRLRMPRDVANAMDAVRIFKAERWAEPAEQIEAKPMTTVSQPVLPTPAPASKRRLVPTPPPTPAPTAVPVKPSKARARAAAHARAMAAARAKAKVQVCSFPGCTLKPREGSVYCTDRHRVDMARHNAKLRANALKTRAAK